jgi:hypothetical protein
MGEREQHRSRLVGVVDLDLDLVLEKGKPQEMALDTSLAILEPQSWLPPFPPN